MLSFITVIKIIYIYVSAYNEFGFVTE